MDTVITNKTDSSQSPAIERKPREKRPIEKLPKRLYTLEEAAPYLGKKDHWGVRHMINHHGLKFVKQGRNILLDIRDMDEWIEKHKDIITF
jgi:excisionase family DNA binding protein